MIEIDGAEGGGQILRSTLALAGVTGKAVRVRNVRGARPSPGLKAQHLAAVDAAATVCRAETRGATLGSEMVTFVPNAPRGGRFGLDVGTAGSVTLVFDTLLPLALALTEPLAVTVRGGTDVRWAPTLAHYRRAKLPLLREAGLDAAVSVERTGFYPDGGGVATLSVWPSTLSPLALSERGARRRVAVYSKASADLADRNVADRQAVAAVEGLSDAGLTVEERTVEYVAADSPGSALAVVAEYERSRAGFDALGARGKPAREVAADTVDETVAFDSRGAVVDAHTADQLVVFLALAGGRVRVPRVTDHVETNASVMRAFGFDVGVDENADGAVLVGP